MTPSALPEGECIGGEALASHGMTPAARPENECIGGEALASHGMTPAALPEYEGTGGEALASHGMTPSALPENECIGGEALASHGMTPSALPEGECIGGEALASHGMTPSALPEGECIGGEALASHGMMPSALPEYEGTGGEALASHGMTPSALPEDECIGGEALASHGMTPSALPEYEDTEGEALASHGMTPAALPEGECIGSEALASPYTLHHLPHIDIQGAYQFITFRTAASTDPYLLQLHGKKQTNSEKQMAIDAYLDLSEKGAYFYTDTLRFMFDFLIEQQAALYTLVCFAIMPNHIHLLIQPKEKLATVMQKIKGKSAREINKRLNRSGKFWARDYYDKGIRDERHFRVVYEYIRNNPLKLTGQIGAPKGALPEGKNIGGEALASHNITTDTFPMARFYGVYQ